MGHYLEKNVQGDEKVLYTAELHWIVYHFGTTITLFGALLGHYGPRLSRLYMGQQMADFIAKPLSYFAIGIIAIGALHLFYGFIRQVSTELVITNQRVIAKYGFIAVTTYELMLYKVEGANIEQTVLGRLLGYGTVMVKGTGGGISPIDHVANPYKFHLCLMQALESANQQGATSIKQNNHNHD